MMPSPRRCLPLVALSLPFACSSGPSEADVAAKAKLAGELVECKDQMSRLKEQLAVANGELKKTKEASDPTIPLGGVALQAGLGQRVEANLSPEQIAGVKKVILSNGSALVACYEKGLKRNPNLRTVDKVAARFILISSGSVRDVAFSPHVDSEMEKCMGAAFRRWKFPTFSGGEAQFELPVNLLAR